MLRARLSPHLPPFRFQMTGKAMIKILPEFSVVFLLLEVSHEMLPICCPDLAEILLPIINIKWYFLYGNMQWLELKKNTKIAGQ